MPIFPILMFGALGAGWWFLTKTDPKLSKYFSESEFTRSAAAAQLGIKNELTPQARANLTRLAVEVLDPLREAIGQPLLVTSGYRSKAVNAAVGGVPNSAHQLGLAVDVKANGIPAAELLRIAVELNLPFDVAMLYESKGHLHLDQRINPPQRRLMFWQPAVGKPQQLTAPMRGSILS